MKVAIIQDESGTPYGYDTYQADYYSTYRNILNNSLTVADVNALIDKIETAISADIALEPFPENTAVTEDFGDIRTFIQDRWDYVDGQLDALAPLEGTVLLDDGFQHLRLERDLDLVVIDAGDPWSGGRLPPRGRLREPVTALERADAVLITKTPSDWRPNFRGTPSF